MASLDRHAEANAAEKKVWSFICIEFRPSEPLVSSISQLVSDFCEVGLTDRDVSYRFRMAAHELAENITKYSTADVVSLEVELFEMAGVHTLSMKTRNEASPDRLAEVERRSEMIADDPITETAHRGWGWRGSALIAGDRDASTAMSSGLGLARIRADACLSFDYSIDGDGYFECPSG